MRTPCYPIVACMVLISVFALRLPGAGAADPSAGRESLAKIDWTLARDYAVVLDEFHFSPSPIVFDHGYPYALRLENKGRFSHTFTAPAFFRSVEMRPGLAASEVERSDGSLTLSAGEVKTVYVVPREAGTYGLECKKLLHGLFGMSGDIVVR